MSALRLAIIGCGAAKLDRAAPARDLYVGPLFRDALGYAIHPGRFDEVRILSAKYGLIRLEQVVEPYNLKLSDLCSQGYGNLSDAVGRHLRQLWGDAPPYSLHVLAGDPYVQLLHRAIEGQRFVPRPCLINLLKGLTQGARRAWFKRERETAR